MSLPRRPPDVRLLYALLGVSLGIVMAANHDDTFKPLHVHLNLLGWASMGLFGLWYRSAPAASETKLARIHFWLHNIALPIQMVTLAMFVGGNESIEPVLALASIVMGIAFVCFAINQRYLMRPSVRFAATCKIFRHISDNPE